VYQLRLRRALTFTPLSPTRSTVPTVAAQTQPRPLYSIFQPPRQPRPRPAPPPAGPSTSTIDLTAVSHPSPSKPLSKQARRS
jgi:hypothetical protein